MMEIVMPSSILRLIAVAAVLLAAISTPGNAANPNALWEIVHNQCVPGQLGGIGPKPCQLVDLAAGYVVLKDLRGATQFLVMPTAEVAGIEDPQILAGNAPNYWAAAWAARRYVAERAGRAIPREDLGLAVNSQSGRTQNQLHIHVDCIRLDVRQALRAHSKEIRQTWAPLAFLMAGHRYRARLVAGSDLDGINPFRLLADGIPGAARDMADQTLVVTGAVFGDGAEGFYLLNDQVDRARGDLASGEELLDHDCGVLRGPT
jgi:CDP-diacylglycerol pyrophosphatase